MGPLAIESNPRYNKEIAGGSFFRLSFREELKPVWNFESPFEFPSVSVLCFKVRREVWVTLVHVPKTQWRVNPIGAGREMMD